jgi:hypothetical protein
MAERDEPEFPDDEGGGESTVAMASPTFDPSVPSPLGDSGGPLPGPTPTPGSSSQGSRAVVPRVAAPHIPGPLPAMAGAKSAAIPRPPRAQTVIGIAPPAEGAQRPPPEAKRANVPALSEFAPEDPLPDDGPTMTGVEGMINAFADVSTPAVATPVRDIAAMRGDRRGRPGSSPLATTTGAPSERGMDARFDKEAVTMAADRSSARALPGLDDFAEETGEDESTRAVPREELMRVQGGAPVSTRDAQLVVGDDAVGEDATLAVAPGMNAANPRLRPATFSQSPMGGPTEPADFRPYPSPGAFPAAHPHAGAPTWDPAQRPWTPPMQGGPMMHPQPYGAQPAPWSQGQPQAAPPRPGMSGQTILLIVVGVVCVTVFLTGIVLFLTTRF